jgi:uncharacterized protein with FMN-binding domain
VGRIVLWLMSTVTVVVLVFGYHTSTSSQLPATSVVASGSGFSAAVNGTTSSGSGAGSGSGSGSGSASGSASTAATTVTGPVASTRWGPVQVQITVANGALTGVTVLQYPSGNGKDQEINDYALPILVQETVDAKNANIDMVSGATVTSEGYLQSLQGALDQAGL